MAYRTPFVSGKDSLNNQFTTQDGRTIEIPPTLLITGMGIVADVAKCVTMDAKSAGNTLLLVGPQEPGVVGAMGGSHYQRMFGVSAEHAAVPRTDLVMGPRTAAVVAKLIQTGLILSAHDVSDGGLLAAIAEMLIAGSTTKRPIGAEVSASGTAALFGESPSRYVLEVAPGSVDAVRKSLGDVPHAVVGKLDESGVLRVGGEQSGVEELAKVWLGTLDW
jgi:phosphoribosylformylglycinamidine synthase